MTNALKNTEQDLTRPLKRSNPSLPNDRCEFCGASLFWTRRFVRELAALVISGIFVIALLVLAGFAAYKSIEHGLHSPLSDPVWHEPLDDWSF
jgi:hypothetical protein